jgi:hypothetical protein
MYVRTCSHNFVKTRGFFVNISMDLFVRMYRFVFRVFALFRVRLSKGYDVLRISCIQSITMY